jgi:putative phosphoesterase
MLRIGLISDTHGLLRPQASVFLRGCDHILHAGDIGDAGILDALRAIAPLTAVRGNNDTGAWAEPLAETQLCTFGPVRVLLLHDLSRLDVDLAATQVRVVVAGHSHKPVVSHREGFLFVNPGSAGPRRFSLPISIGELLVDEHGETSARTVELPGPAR